VHGDIVVPKSSVVEARVVEDVRPELRGIRVPGTGIPGVIASGPVGGSFGQDSPRYTAEGPGVVVERRPAVQPDRRHHLRPPRARCAGSPA